MKKLVIASSLLFTVLTAVEPIFAADDTSSTRGTIAEEVGPTRLSDLGMHLNPQMGVSSIENSASNGGAHSKFTGGATVEFGQEVRKLETGLIVMQTGSDITLRSGKQAELNNTFLTIPMMAKLRVFSLPSQSWYAKFGFTTAFLMNSNDRANSNAIDVLAGAGMGGRFGFTKKSDFVVEATYNRGFMNVVPTGSTNFNQGFLVMAGLSFQI